MDSIQKVRLLKFSKNNMSLHVILQTMKLSAYMRPIIYGIFRKTSLNFRALYLNAFSPFIISCFQFP